MGTIDGRNLSLAQLWPVLKASVTAWIDDYAPSMGAALSYYTVFSLAPVLLIVIAIAGLVFGEDAARGALFDQLNALMGKNAAMAVQGLLANANKPFQGIAATVIGVGVLLIGATTVFGELQDALDRIWRVPERSRAAGLWSLLRTRLLSFGMILGIAFLLMVSLILSAVVSALGKWWSPYFGGWEVLAQAVTFVVGFIVTTLGFALIYKLMPRAVVRWHDVWIGAAVTALLFSLGRFLIGLYIGKSGVASGFGAAGSLVIVFLWVYYSAQIFLLGAEFTWAFANAYGSRRAGLSTSSAEVASVTKPNVLDRPRSAKDVDAAATAAPSARPVSTGDVIGGVAVAVAFRYGVPWLLRRLGGSTLFRSRRARGAWH